MEASSSFINRNCTTTDPLEEAKAKATNSTLVETHVAFADNAVSQCEDSTGGSANNTSEDKSKVQETLNNPVPSDVKQPGSVLGLATGSSVILKHDDTTPLEIKKSLLSTTRVMVDRGKHEHAIAAKYYRSRHDLFIFLPLEILVSFNILNYIRLM